MQLARVFADYMVLQCDKPLLIWGCSEKEEKLSVKINGLKISKLSIEDIMAVGPGDPNEPAALYENMLKEIIGYSVQGVIWYQGETDDKKPQMYGKLFSALIACWRKDWKEKNAAMDKLPFLFVQFAPFGTWRDNPSEADGLELEGDSIKIRFKNGEGLYKKENDFSAYNGFALSDIREDLIPPVLDGAGGLLVYSDGEVVAEASCSVKNGQLLICSPQLKNASHVRVEFAQIGFYQVNLYNGADIPVKPFVLEIHNISG